MKSDRINNYLLDNNFLKVWMIEAIAQAQRASSKNEVPVGALIVDETGILAANHNRIKEMKDPTAHAEFLCIKEAANKKNSERPGGILFTTLEPCLMCCGASILARINAIVFAAKDPKSGACGSVLNVFEGKKFNHQVQILGGVLAQESSIILKDFFIQKRQKKGLAKNKVIRK